LSILNRGEAYISLFGCIPTPRTFGIDSQVNLQDVGAVEGLRHALNNYGLGHISRLCRSFQLSLHHAPEICTFQFKVLIYVAFAKGKYQAKEKEEIRE
jgi:hypothetical protein